MSYLQGSVTREMTSDDFFPEWAYCCAIEKFTLHFWIGELENNNIRTDNGYVPLKIHFYCSNILGYEILNNPKLRTNTHFKDPLAEKKYVAMNMYKC